MSKVITFAGVGEALTGFALLIAPSLVGQLLFGQDLTGIAVIVARVAGIALIGLGVTLWPGIPVLGMLIYSGMVAVYLAFIGLNGGLTGYLLWPVVVLHAVLAALLVRLWLAK